MAKSKAHMPKDLERKCKNTIHLAAAEAAAAGAIPIPMSDSIPITMAQIGMVVQLGKIFDLTISETAAKTLLGLGMTKEAGRAFVSSILKSVPGIGTVVGGVISGATAAALTEALGWIVADDFYQVYSGSDPNDIFGAADTLRTTFSGARMHKKQKK